MQEVLHFHRQQQATATLVLRPDPEAAAYGLVETDRRGRIRRLRGNPPEVSEPLSSYMFTGLQILEPRIFDFMPELRPFGTTKETYPRMIAEDAPIYGFVHAGPWLVVDDEAGVRQATQELLSGRIRLSYLRP